MSTDPNPPAPTYPNGGGPQGPGVPPTGPKPQPVPALKLAAGGVEYDNLAQPDLRTNPPSVTLPCALTVEQAEVFWNPSDYTIHPVENFQQTLTTSQIWGGK